MPTAIQRTTIVAIKRHAKRLRSELSIPLTKAQDQSAIESGFQNFRHALNVLADPSRTDDGPPVVVHVTAYWRTPDYSAGGRETLRLQLRRPWRELIEPRQFSLCRGLTPFKGKADDHLVVSQVMDKQESARIAVCAAARALQFMDATGLRPSRKFKLAYPKENLRSPLKGEDHSSIWSTADGSAHLIVDEPYDLSVRQHEEARAAWAKRHDFEIHHVPDWGMYYPQGGAVMFLISAAANRGVLLRALAALRKADPPLVEEQWSGESAPSRPIFRSPCELSAGVRAGPPRDPQMARPSKATRGYVRTFVGARRRPNARLPVEMHEEVGRLIKEALAVSALRPGVANRLESVRDELDEWAMREYDRTELEGSRFFDLYFNGPTRTTFARAIPQQVVETHLAALGRISAILTQHYPASAPLKRVLGKLDLAKRSLHAWKPAEARRS